VVLLRHKLIYLMHIHLYMGIYVVSYVFFIIYTLLTIHERHSWDWAMKSIYKKCKISNRNFHIRWLYSYVVKQSSQIHITRNCLLWDQCQAQDQYLPIPSRSSKIIRQETCQKMFLVVLVPLPKASYKNSIQKEIKSKQNSGNVCYHSVQNVLSSSVLSKNIGI